MRFQKVSSPIGTLYITENGTAITHLTFGPTGGGGQEGDSPLLQACSAQLAEYFSGKRRTFTLPLEPTGTPFQERVWHALLQIPYGETWSYKMLAEAAGSPRGYRAVGLANNRNPISILIPCHRVIGSDGSLTGYGGGLTTKIALLQLEGATGYH